MFWGWRRHGGIESMVGLNDLKGLLQPKQFFDSTIQSRDLSDLVPPEQSREVLTKEAPPWDPAARRSIPGG